MANMIVRRRRKATLAKAPIAVPSSPRPKQAIQTPQSNSSEIPQSSGTMAHTESAKCEQLHAQTGLPHAISIYGSDGDGHVYEGHFFIDGGQRASSRGDPRPVREAAIQDRLQIG